MRGWQVLLVAILLLVSFSVAQAWEGKRDNMSVPELKTLDYDELADEAISVCIKGHTFTAITVWDLERKSDATGYLLKIARVLKKKHGKDKPIPQWFNDILTRAGDTCSHRP